MRTLAIDLGSRRIGLALSDDGGRFATPVDVLQVTDPDQALGPIAALIKKEGVRRLVVGLPLNMDDSIGFQARSTLAWAGRLAKLTGLGVIFVDERLSSFAAEQGLIDRKREGEKITRKQRKARLDALVAAGLLQEFLDGRLPPLEVGN